MSTVASPAAAALGARRTDMAVLAAISFGVAAIQLAVLAADLYGGVDHYDLVRDPNAIAGQPNYFGAVSHLGILLWIAGAVCALQAFWVCADKRRTPRGGALLWGGVFAAIMGIDDLLMLHESVAAAGVPEPLVLLPHLATLLALCHHAFRQREDGRWPLLVGAVVAFGLSMVVDVFPVAFGGQVFIEESLKLLGISLLAAYLVGLSHAALSLRRRTAF